MGYRKSHPIAAFREMIFTCASSSTGLPMTGLTFSGGDLQIRKSGASAYVNCNATQQTAVVEIGGGGYVYTFTTAELDTVGVLAFKLQKTGVIYNVESNSVEQAYFMTAVTGTLTTVTFTSNRTETTDDYWKDCLVIALDGALAGQVKKVGAYAGSSKLFTLATGFVWTAAPVNGTFYELVDR